MTSADGLIYVERVINLQRGTRHTVNSIDVFLDNPYFEYDVDAIAIQVILSSQPMLLTSEQVSATNNFQNDTEVQHWLILMEYKLAEIEYVKAIVLSGFKADVQVQITVKLK